MAERRKAGFPAMSFSYCASLFGYGLFFSDATSRLLLLLSHSKHLRIQHVNSYHYLDSSS